MKDNTFVPTGIEDFPGTDPVLGLSFGHTLTVDLSQMTQTDFQGKTLHLEGKVILDGGDSQKSFKGLSLEMGKGAEVTLKNVDITGRDNTPVLKATGGTSTLSITVSVTLTGGVGTKNRPGILVNGNDTLTIQSGTDDGSPGQLTVKAAGGAQGIDNGYSNLKITGVTLSAAGSGNYAGIQPGHTWKWRTRRLLPRQGVPKRRILAIIILQRNAADRPIIRFQTVP
ncbi:hypothetical protein [Eubacterium aggregans]|uniref:hypothetical protein n=1 Tax=Eubacterium aggregans TaxID=81409 RepID=UPI003F38AD22